MPNGGMRRYLRLFCPFLNVVLNTKAIVSGDAITTRFRAILSSVLPDKLRLSRVLCLVFILTGSTLTVYGEGIHLIGDFRFARVGNVIQYEIDEIQNSYAPFFGDATISLGIWATSRPFSYGTLSGFKLVEVNMGVLRGRIEYYDVMSHAEISEPPFGSYNIALVLSEWNGVAFDVIDVINRRRRHTFGSPFSLKYEGARYLEAGWKSLPWVGLFNDHGFPWIFHAEHGWIFLAADTTRSAWIWSGDMGWWWASEDFYPFIYRVRDDSWLWYRDGSSSPRWFLNLTTGQWEEL